MREIWKCAKLQLILNNDYAAILDPDSFHFCQMQKVALQIQTDFTLDQSFICLLWFPYHMDHMKLTKLSSLCNVKAVLQMKEFRSLG